MWHEVAGNGVEACNGPGFEEAGSVAFLPRPADLAGLIARHRSLISHMDGVLSAEQQALRGILTRPHGSEEDAAAPTELGPATGDTGFTAWRQGARLIRRHVRMPTRATLSSFARNVLPGDRALFDDLEERLELLGHELKEVEHLVLESSPASIGEAFAKLHFVADLLADGAEFDHDYFLYLIMECVECIARHEAELTQAALSTAARAPRPPKRISSGR